MKVQRIIILLLVFSMLFVNATSVLAIEIQNDNVEVLYYEENITENDISTNSVGDVDSQNILAQIKPANKLYYDDKVIHQTDNFAPYYFSNLKEHFGYNTKGSCGYVATAMMLSYYDTYLNDDIISPVFDVPVNIADLKVANLTSSPGIKREDDSICPGYVPSPTGDDPGDYLLRALDIDEYWDLIVDNYYDYFHLNLIKLAEDQFNMYHDTLAVLEECGITIEIDTQYPCATTLLHQKSVIEYYLYQVKGLEGQVSLEYTNQNIREFTIDKLKGSDNKEGQPVMLLLGSSTGFHLVVAYDLDENGTEDNSDDTIYAHYGWGKEQLPDGTYKDYTHINIDTDNFPWLVSALAINFDGMAHSCSNNYEYMGKDICSCAFSIHPEHKHIYKKYNSDKHTYACDCQPVVYLDHNMVLSANISLTQHGYICRDCNYVDESTVESHSYNYWEYVNETTHRSECGCGANGNTTAPHAFTQATFPNLGKMICVGCGYTKTSGSGIGQIIKSINKVSINGSYTVHDGTIMLVEEDVEAYLNGTLVFYDRDKLPVTQ